VRLSVRSRAIPLQALTLLLLLRSAALRGDTQSFASAGQGLALFGRLGSARLASLGGAFHPLAQGPDALLVNPAGIASTDALQVGLHHESWLADINQESLYAVTPVGVGKAFGVYAHVIDYGTFELRDTNGARIGDLSARDYAVGAAFGVASRQGFSFGVGVRGVRENLLRDDLFEAAVDTGVTWQGRDGWSGGLAGVNLGTSINGKQGAESVRWGIAKKADYSGSYFWPALGFTWEPNVTPSLNFGAEAGLGGNFFMRMGYEHRFVETLLDGVSGLTVGLGFKAGSIGFDYAYLPYGDLGAGHRVTLNWTQPPWPKSAPKPTPAPTPVVVPTPLAADLSPPTQNLVYVADPLANAKAMEAEGRLGEALADYEKVAQEKPDLPGVWRAIADLAYKLHDKPKAVAAYHRLLALEPNPDLSAWLKRFEAEPAPSAP
jgi:hypothetical protein